MDISTPEMVLLARELAMKWLTPVDRGRAEKTVEVLREMPGIRPNLSTEHFLEAVAWSADLLAKGTADGKKITPEMLEEAGLLKHVVHAIATLTKEKWMTEWWYARELLGAHDLVKLVACAKRIVKMEDAKALPESHWRTLATETERWFTPLTEDLPPPYGRWLKEKLEALTATR